VNLKKSKKTLQEPHNLSEAELKSHLRVVPGWPKKGVNFIDITTLLMQPDVFRSVVQVFADYFRKKRLDVIVGIEARGFIIGAPVAYELGIPFVPARKKGKLPYDKLSMEYTLEYGAEYVEIHKDAIQPGQRVGIIDDLLATGGTAQAALKLVEQMRGSVVALAFLVELDFLKGREKLGKHDLLTLVHYQE
jgi:adenine phosphoribosyltransferase